MLHLTGTEKYGVKSNFVWDFCCNILPCSISICGPQNCGNPVPMIIPLMPSRLPTHFFFYNLKFKTK